MEILYRVRDKEDSNNSDFEEVAPKNNLTPTIIKLYHATTPKKVKLYKMTGYIKAPVRGFTTLQAAMCWVTKQLQ